MLVEVSLNEKRFKCLHTVVGQSLCLWSTAMQFQHALIDLVQSSHRCEVGDVVKNVAACLGAIQRIKREHSAEGRLCRAYAIELIVGGKCSE